jgi:hypothetical protein
MDCILAIKHIIKKRWEFNQETHILFMDYVKAFENVLRNKLCNIMTTKGYPQHLIDTVVHLYNGTFITIDNATISSRFEVTNQGVKQGCPLSPALFNIYLDAAVNEWQSHLVTHFKLRKWTLNMLMFADDQVIFAKSENDLQFATQLLYNITSEYILEISSNNS